MLEVLVKDFLRLIHHLFAHEYEKLTAFVAGFVARAEIVLHNLDDRLLLVTILRELVQNGSQGGSGRARHRRHAILTELKEHGKELGVDDPPIEKGSELAQVLGKHFFRAPLSTGLIECLSDVLDVA